jgi:hypothetical protein
MPKIQSYTLTDPTGVSKYSNGDGIFFPIVDGAIRSQQTCRESVEHRFQEFLKQNPNHKIMFGKKLQLGFKSDQINPAKLAAFWNPIFKKLGKESVFFFHTCNVENTVVVNMREFWMQNQITRHVFTMLIRASCVYASFDDASKNYYILKNTLNAFDYFMEGNIAPTFQPENPSRGWYYYFQRYANPDLKKLLVNPKAD